MHSFCINPADGWAGGVRTVSWIGRLDAGPPPSWSCNLFMSKPISKKHSDSVQSEIKKNMIFFFFIVIIILFVMVIIMYNVKFPLFYFAYVFFFWKSVLSLLETVSCEQRVPSPFTSLAVSRDTVEHLWLGSTHTDTHTHTHTHTHIYVHMHKHTFKMKRLSRQPNKSYAVLFFCFMKSRILDLKSCTYIFVWCFFFF